MNEFKSWFDPLDERLVRDKDSLTAGGMGGRSIAPAQDDVPILLEMGKFAAETSSQRYFALLTAFAVGRALGRAERDDPFLHSSAFLHEALDIVRETGPRKAA